MPLEPGNKTRSVFRRWPFGIGLVLSAMFFAVAAVIRFSPAPADDLFYSFKDLPPDGRPAFVTTEYRYRNIPPHAPIQVRLFFWLSRLGRGTWTFPPAPASWCSVSGLLNQSTQVTGTRYLIAREALWKRVYCGGHTNALSGPQWVALFEQALRSNGLVLVSNRTRVIKVIPGEDLEAYRKAGLIGAGQ